MKRSPIVLVALAGVVLATGLVLAQRENVPNTPGYPTLARVHVLNRERSEAVSVAIQDATVTLPVALTGTANVALAPSAVVATRQTRQGWEYRQLSSTSGQDIVELLNKAGTEGWEAVGTVSGAASTPTWILKRPR
jgi:hypothetical protein